MQSINSLISTLSHYQPVLMRETPQSAAVMVLLVVSEANELSIVLTERASTLPTYAGDYSFPGGMFDKEDGDLYATAIRETKEELNLSSHLYQHIGQLDDFEDRYGHLVRPYVAIMNKNIFMNSFKSSPDEIAGIYFFPLSKLNQLEDTPSLHTITRRYPSYSFTEGKVFVWGLTAGILVHLSNIIFNQQKLLGKKVSKGK